MVKSHILEYSMETFFEFHLSNLQNFLSFEKKNQNIQLRIAVQKKQISYSFQNAAIPIKDDANPLGRLQREHGLPA